MSLITINMNFNSEVKNMLIIRGIYVILCMFLICAMGEASLMEKDIVVCSRSTVYRAGPTLHLRLTLALCCPNFAIVLLNWTKH